MSERPILFNAEMVRAVLSGRKTQTRRVIKLPPDEEWCLASSTVFDEGVIFADSQIPDEVLVRHVAHLPYGQPGDRLWVRETWAVEPCFDAIKPRDIPADAFECYRAEPQSTAWAGKWRPSIFMPRWASRITLEVIGVRVERVQDITPEDAIAEGLDRTKLCGMWRWTSADKKSFGACAKPTSAFSKLWDSINAKRGFGWDSNPWVWVVEFKVRP